MPEFNFGIITSSFIAGMLTFFAPCTLPLVPAFLGIISGATPAELGDPEKLNLIRSRIFRNALFYVLGFSLVFITFGVAFSYLGTVVAIKLWLEKIGGLFIVAFGLVLLGWLKIPALDSDKHIAVPRLFRNVSMLNSFFLGALFALGWSPCVGPLLGSVLLLATTSGTALEGTILLVFFSIGLGIPFLLTSLLIGRAVTGFVKWSKAITIINKTAGVFLIVIGFLLILGRFSSFSNEFKLFFFRFNYFESFVDKFL